MASVTSLPVSTHYGPAPSATRAQAKIMIVDDEPVAINVVRRYLVRAGFRDFVTTVDAREAFDLIMRQQPDVILLDIVMPHVSGLELLQEIRRRRDLDHVPVIIFTVADDQKTKIAALELGATDFLGKPLDPCELAPRVSNAVLVKQQQDQLRRYARELEQRVAEVTRAEAQIRDYVAALETANQKLRKFRDKVQIGGGACERCPSRHDA